MKGKTSDIGQQPTQSGGQEQGRDAGKSWIEVHGARVHNLKNIDVCIPRNSLTVITGLSGSGKSSLAFDTIFAEGQRRYIDTFSSYSRGYIGQIQRPDVDQISGLSPVISIDQKTTSRNARSTVGTITEVYDYLRLLFARAATAYSWASGEQMVKLTDNQIIDILYSDYSGKKIYLLAPMVNSRKGHYKELFENLRRKGYLMVRVDGEMMDIVPGMKLDRYKNHTIEVVIDRLKLKNDESEEDTKRLRQSVGKAMEQGGGMMMIAEMETKHPTARYFSRNLMCPTTGLSYAEPAPHTFSFNSPKGWCPRCKGLGYIKEEQTEEDAMDAIIHADNWYEQLQAYQVNDNEEDKEKDDDEQRTVCPDCQGKRLNKEALSYRFAGKSIDELADMDIDVLLHFLQHLPSELTNQQKKIAEPIVKEICARLQFMVSVGLTYLSLSRSSDSLSGGESQRIRLATQIGSRLVNVLYILDEPSIGLHQRDNQRLIDSLKELRDMGNSVVVVEHDEQMMREADYVVDIGPKAGRLGGHLMYQGTPAGLIESDTLTGKYLRGETPRPSKKSPVIADKNPKNLVLRGCRGNNLKDVTARFPLGKMIGVTGVSGSGKSTLINQTLFPIMSQYFYHSLKAPLPYEELVVEYNKNGEVQSEPYTRYIDKVVAVNQAPIGRTPRSNPATYTNVFTDIRALFAQLPESKIRGWKAGHFSFNTKGGRCEACGGNGYKTIRMNFMPDVYVACETCGGMRYGKETLEVRFKGKTIADVLNMTVNQAVEFFESQPSILRRIKTIQDVGLGYIKLGQASSTLSGGESQRIKLATELSRPSTGKTLYILDEPTTGLHFEDIRVLLDVLRRLTDKGNTVIIIEHNLDVIQACDYLIDLGPEGGRSGGQIVAYGTQDDLRNCPKSLTGRFV